MNVPWRGRDAIGVFLLTWVALPIAIVLAARTLAPIWPWANWLLNGLLNGDTTASFTLTFLDAIGGLVLVGAYLRHHHLNWSAVGWRRFSVVKAILLVVGLFVAFTILANLALLALTALDPHFNANQAQTNDFTGEARAAHPNLALIALVVLPPILEETVFRGFIFPALSKRWGVVVGAILSSALFGLAHLQANISVYTFILGLALCFLYVKLRSTIPGMILHALNNYLALLALK